MIRGKICIPVCARTIAELQEQMQRAETVADVIELRFDGLDPGENIADLRVMSEKRLVCTYRPVSEGGYSGDDTAKRLEFWRKLACDPVFKDALFDLEADVIADVDIPVTRKVASAHDFSGVPAYLEEIFENLARDGDVVKIAVQTADAIDALPVWKLSEGGVKTIPVAMGDAGKWTRILGPAYGAFLTYASLKAGSETAPGQISAEEMRDLYRVNYLNKKTLVYGIIGDPITQSQSPHMHNPAFRSRDINSVFIPFLVRDLDAFVRQMLRPTTSEVAFKFGGLAVTMPHKEAIMRYLDEIDETARSIGAVNTLKIENDKLIGSNTDAHGFIIPLKRAYSDLKGSRVAIFGAGGAARACIYGLKNEGASVTLFARDTARAKSVAADSGIAVQQIAETASRKPNTPFAGFDILVNATPYGMGSLENETPYMAEDLAGLKLVYDLVTKHHDTPIVREGKLAGALTIGGLEMLIAQGAEQFRRWTGQDISDDEMRANVMRRPTV